MNIPCVLKSQEDFMAQKNWYSSETQVFWTCKALMEKRTISAVSPVVV
jgi:hypothetical protein